MPIHAFASVLIILSLPISNNFVSCLQIKRKTNAREAAAPAMEKTVKRKFAHYNIIITPRHV
jgi:hypothetical protein